MWPTAVVGLVVTASIVLVVVVVILVNGAKDVFILVTFFGFNGNIESVCHHQN